MNFSISSYACHTEEQIADIFHTFFKPGEELKEHPDLNKDKKDYLALWKEKNEIEQPGYREIRAFAVYMRYKRKLPIKMKRWSTFCYEFCCDLCGKNNVLSDIFIDDDEFPGVIIFIYPLIGRELIGERWVNLDGTIKRNVEKDFRKRIKIDIGHFVDEEEEQRRQALLKEAELYPLLNRKIIMQSEESDDEFWLDDDNEELFYDTISKEMAIQTDQPYDTLQRVLSIAVNYFTQGVEKRTFKDAIAGRITEKDFMRRVDSYIANNYPQLTFNDRTYIKEKVRSAVFGYYVLDQLIKDKEISDIKIMAWDKIRVKMRGKRYTSNLHFQSPQDYDRFMDGVAVRNNINFAIRPQSIFSDPYTSEDFRLRFDVTAPIINSDFKYYLHIRKTPKKKPTVEELINVGMMPRIVADFLKNEVRHNSVLIVGKGSAGKTTMLNQFLEWLPYDKAGAVIQESDELFSNNHPEIEFQKILYEEQSPTGKEIGLKELTRAALVSDQDYIVIGEVKGGEALYAINAAMTGYIFICTVHADSSQSGIDKMADYITYESKYDKETAAYMLKAIKTVVFMKDFKVEEISQVTGWNEEKKKLEYQMVYARDPQEYLRKKQMGLIQ